MCFLNEPKLLIFHFNSLGNELQLVWLSTLFFFFPYHSFMQLVSQSVIHLQKCQCRTYLRCVLLTLAIFLPILFLSFTSFHLSTLWWADIVAISRFLLFVALIYNTVHYWDCNFRLYLFFYSAISIITIQKILTFGPTVQPTKRTHTLNIKR